MISRYGIFSVTHKKPIGMTGTIRKLRNTPHVYEAKELCTLLNESSNYIVVHKDKKCKVLRFLLRTDGNLVFAKEGYPQADVPAHFQMANADATKALCISAGNIYFDEKNQVCCLNHKSGDFRPEFATLQFVLDELIKNKVPMNETIDIEELDYRGGLLQHYTVTPKATNERKQTQFSCK